MIENITYKSNNLAIIIRNTYIKKKGVNFFTKKNLIQQVAYMNHKKNHIIQPHLHKDVVRKIRGTSEVLIILNGIMKIISNILIYIIKLYKIFISPHLTPSCRYLPTCSEYAIDCLNTYGLILGSGKAIKRIFSCHPIKFLGGGEGFDPVIKDIKVKK